MTPRKDWGRFEYRPERSHYRHGVRIQAPRRLKKGVDTTTTLGLDFTTDMIRVALSTEQQPENQSVYDAAESRPGLPIKLRVQPQLYVRTVPYKAYRTGAFHAWRHVHWSVECQTVEEAIGVKDVLSACFRALQVMEPGEAQMVLDAATAQHVESATAKRTQHTTVT